MATICFENKNIVIIGQQPWDTELGSNCKDIALEFSKRNRVLYVNSPLDRITSIRHQKDVKVRYRLDVISGKQDGLTQVKENLWTYYPNCIVESINWLDNVLVFNAINRLNNRKFANAIKKSLTKLGFDEFILLNDNEIIKCFYLKEHLKPILTLYYSRDFIIAAPYWSKHGTRLEPIMIKKCDMCLANSVYLMNYCKQYNTNSYYIGQGYDDKLFSPSLATPTPEELMHIRGKIVGYVGVLHSSRLDIETMMHIATQGGPDWTMVLVGPEDQEFASSELHNYTNVIFVGMKSMNELPAYIQAFDVCINPQFLTPLTIGNYPRKIDEYLAMGKPVVALKTHAMEMFAPFTYLANDKQEYVELIQKALEEDNEDLRQQRMSFASYHTWENSVALVYEAISERLSVG